MLLDKDNPWQLPILYDFETDRIVYNTTMMTDEIFQANRPKEILLEAVQ